MRVMQRSLSIAALSAVGLGGCSDDNGGTGGGGGALSLIGIYQESFVDAASTFGGLAIDAAAATSTAPMFSVRSPSVATVALRQVAPTTGMATITGTFDHGTGELTAQNAAYSFDGTYDGSSRLEGTWSSNTLNGVFVALKDDGSGMALCGTYTGATGNGLLAFVTVNGTLAGNAFSAGSLTPLAVDGTLVGSTVTFSSTVGAGTGTINGLNANGTIDAGGGVSFTWSAVDCTP